MRLSIFMLCLVLFAAVAGKYKAEAAVRAATNQIEQLKADQDAVIREVQLLRAEVAYLESPERLSMIADSVTNLQPLSGRQLMTADDFLASLEVGEDEPNVDAAAAPAVSAKRLGAVAMAEQLKEAQR